MMAAEAGRGREDGGGDSGVAGVADVGTSPHPDPAAAAAIRSAIHPAVVLIAGEKMSLHM
jgi:hypothetical protein